MELCKQPPSKLAVAALSCRGSCAGAGSDSTVFARGPEQARGSNPSPVASTRRRLRCRRRESDADRVRQRSSHELLVASCFNGELRKAPNSSCASVSCLGTPLALQSGDRSCTREGTRRSWKWKWHPWATRHDASEKLLPGSSRSSLDTTSTGSRACCAVRAPCIALGFPASAALARKPQGMSACFERARIPSALGKTAACTNVTTLCHSSLLNRTCGSTSSRESSSRSGSSSGTSISASSSFCSNSHSPHPRSTRSPPSRGSNSKRSGREGALAMAPAWKWRQGCEFCAILQRELEGKTSILLHQVRDKRPVRSFRCARRQPSELMRRKRTCFA